MRSEHSSAQSNRCQIFSQVAGSANIHRLLALAGTKKSSVSLYTLEIVTLVLTTSSRVALGEARGGLIKRTLAKRLS